MHYPRILFAMTTAAALFTSSLSSTAVAAQWAPTSTTLLTRWGKQVTPENAWQVYPRPQLAREDWQNLNGIWQLAMGEGALAAEPKFDKQILVPYPVESALSGVGEHSSHLLYKRSFKVPSAWKNQRVVLHFDACDWQTSITVNGKAVKTLDGEDTHQGGYDRFSYDITDALKADGDNELRVSVFDPSEKGQQPRGKQVTNPHGIWYTPTSGIWQTVWLESVSGRGHVRSVKFTPDAKTGEVDIKIDAPGASSESQLMVEVDGATITAAPGEAIAYQAKQPHLWSPEDPHLYDVIIRVKDGDEIVDTVKTYFAFRSIEMKKVGEFQRIFLNGKEIFQSGPLDQGFWPDGLYTPPTPEALTWDVDYTRELGFNMIRKHIKIEPDVWYNYCDKTGMLVWQDCVSGVSETPESHRLFEQDMKRLITSHYNHPSIVLWVLFNEGWGQYDTERITEDARKLDNTRLITNPSGWVDKGVGDTQDMHKYPGPGAPDPDPKRASVLGEFGGLGYFVEGHSWSEGHWGYQNLPTIERLTDRFVGIMHGLQFLRATHGLNAAVYTQTTDVEIETNGLVTYDREVKKIDSAVVREANEAVINMTPLRVLAETALSTTGTAEKSPRWQFTTEKPADDWMKPEFAAEGWKTAPGGFGDVTKRIFGPVNTAWKSEDIWLRREVELPADTKAEDVKLIIENVDSAEVYLNGMKAAEIKYLVTGYTPVAISNEARKTLKPGAKNVMAIHCHNIEDENRRRDIGQYIDAGLIEQAQK